MNSFAKAIEELSSGKSLRCSGFDAIKMQGAYVLVDYPGTQPAFWVSVYTLRASLEEAVDALPVPEIPQPIRSSRRGRAVVEEGEGE